MTAKTERADAIRWIQAQMDDYGLTLEDLDAAVCLVRGHYTPIWITVE